MIRHAAYTDIDQCVDLIRKANTASDNYQRPFNADRVKQDLMVRVMNPYSLILVNDDVSGLLVAFAIESYFFGYKTANEFFYAEKDGLALIREYKRWAMQWGDNTIVDISLSFGGVRGQRAQKVFEREGFEVVGPQMRLIH